MPARGERGDDGQEALPAGGTTTMDQDEGRSGIRTLGVVERDLTRITTLFVEHQKLVPSSVKAVSRTEAS